MTTKQECVEYLTEAFGEDKIKWTETWLPKKERIVVEGSVTVTFKAYARTDNIGDIREQVKEELLAYSNEVEEEDESEGAEELVPLKIVEDRTTEQRVLDGDEPKAKE